MDDQIIKDAIENASFDDLIESIKKLPVFSSYVTAVRRGTENTNKLLMFFVLFSGLTDQKLRAELVAVSNEILFSLMDLRLRSEILSEEIK